MTPADTPTPTNNLKQYGDRPVRPGRYRVAYTSLELVVEEGRVYLRGRTVSPQFIDFSVPLDHHTEIDPEDADARQKVLDYLAAAWPHRLWAQLNEWMAECEDEDGLSVWRGYMNYGRNMAGNMDSDPNRPLIEQEVTAWLEQHQPQQDQP
jgi:hypothetical protein